MEEDNSAKAVSHVDSQERAFIRETTSLSAVGEPGARTNNIPIEKARSQISPTLY